jgi:SAM-dependent methyltransferase
MNSQPFRVGAYNVHYEGRYCERVLLGRRLGVADKADHVRELLGEDSMDSVLEVGCGTGAVLAALRERAVGRSRQGVDLADPAKHADLHAADIPMWSYDGHTQPFADRSVDLVLASHVVEHVSEPRRLLAEMSRVAARAIFVEVPCELHLRTTRHELQRMLDIGHINAYTPESFQLLLETSSPQIQRLKIWDHSLAVHSLTSGALRARLKWLLRRGLLRISKTPASRLFAYHCGVLARPAHAVPAGH